MIGVVIASVAKMGGEDLPASAFAYGSGGLFWGFIAAEFRNWLSPILYRTSLRRQVGNGANHRR